MWLYSLLWKNNLWYAAQYEYALSFNQTNLSLSMPQNRLDECITSNFPFQKEKRCTFLIIPHQNITQLPSNGIHS